MRRIVESIHFDTEPKLNKSPIQTEAFLYTDKDSGISFTVPANWVETPMNEERKYLDAKFSSILEEGLCIIFSSEDIYESEDLKSELTATEKFFLTRAAIGNDIFPKAYIAEMCGCKEKDVSIVTYGGIEYYSAETVASGTAYGGTLSIPMVYLIRCENGYLYTFQFNGTSDSKYFKDFKSLVTSAEYPEFENNEIIYQVVGAYLLLAFALFLILYTLPVLIYRYGVIKAPVDKKKSKKITLIYGICVSSVFAIASYILNAGWVLEIIVILWSWINYRVLIGGHSKVPKVQTDSFQAEEAVNEPSIDLEADDMQTAEAPFSCDVSLASDSVKSTERELIYESVVDVSFCHRCGNKLPSGSLFCNKCGTKVPMENQRDYRGE